METPPIDRYGNGKVLRFQFSTRSKSISEAGDGWVQCSGILEECLRWTTCTIRRRIAGRSPRLTLEELRSWAAVFTLTSHSRQPQCSIYTYLGWDNPLTKASHLQDHGAEDSKTMHWFEKSYFFLSVFSATQKVKRVLYMMRSVKMIVYLWWPRPRETGGCSLGTLCSFRGPLTGDCESRLSCSAVSEHAVRSSYVL